MTTIFGSDAAQVVPGAQSPAVHGRALQRTLVAVAVAKLVYLTQYVALPFLYGPLFDAQVYMLQARRVSEGRFGDATLLAFSPLYGYVLATLGARQGSILPILVQLALGLGNVALVHRITARFFGATAALVSAIAYAGYGPLLQLETKIMSETLGLSLLLLGIERMSSAPFAAGRLTVALQAGVCVALAVLARASLLMLMPLLVLVALLQRPGSRTVMPQRALVFAAAVGLMLGSYGAWTKLHSGLFVPVILTSNTAARATQQDWAGDLSVFRGRTEPAVSAFSVVQQARQRLRREAHGEPEPLRESFLVGGYLSQVPAKLALTFRDRETTFDYGFYGERSELWALRLPFVSFGMLLVFGTAGFAALVRGRTARRDTALMLLGAVVLGTLLTTTLFHPSTRYRLPLVIALAPLAGHAWALALAMPRSGRRRLTLSAYACVALGLAVFHQARPLDHPGLWELRVAEAAAQEGDVVEAHARIARAFEREGHSAYVRERAAYVESLLPREIRVGDE